MPSRELTVQRKPGGAVCRHAQGGEGWMHFAHVQAVCAKIKCMRLHKGSLHFFSKNNNMLKKNNFKVWHGLC